MLKNGKAKGKGKSKGKGNEKGKVEVKGKEKADRQTVYWDEKSKLKSESWFEKPKKG